MTWTAWWVLLLATPGVFFLSVGTLGLLRLRELHSRIHAVAKADTLGLGLVALALLPLVESVGAGLKMLVVWALALVSAATIAHLLARGVRPEGLAEPFPDEGPDGGAQRPPGGAA